MKVNTLADLKKIKAALTAQAAREAAAAAERALQARLLEARRNQFRAAVGKVERLRDKGLADLAAAPPDPIPRQHQLDEQAAWQEAISDEMDITTLLDTDDCLSFRRPGVGLDVTQKLRKGQWTIQRQTDLHGMRTEEARLALTQFIREAHKHGIRCVRVVHGKGLGSPGKTPVLKDKVHRWLVQKTEVIAFVQAPPSQGGAGALLVLLQPVRVGQAQESVRSSMAMK